MRRPLTQNPQATIIRGTVQLLTVGALLALAGPPASAQSPSPSGSSPGQTQARPGRRIVVSTPDRQLVLLEADRVVKTYPIAVVLFANDVLRAPGTVLTDTAVPEDAAPRCP